MGCIHSRSIPTATPIDPEGVHGDDVDLGFVPIIIDTGNDDKAQRRDVTAEQQQTWPLFEEEQQEWIETDTTTKKATAIAANESSRQNNRRPESLSQSSACEREPASPVSMAYCSGTTTTTTTTTQEQPTKQRQQVLNDGTASILMPCAPNFHPGSNCRLGYKVDQVYENRNVLLGHGKFGCVYQGSHRMRFTAAAGRDDGGDRTWHHVAVKKTTPTVLDRREGGRIRTVEDVEAREQEVKVLLRLRGEETNCNAAASLPILFLYEYFWDYDKTTGKGDVYLVTELLGQQLDHWRLERKNDFTEATASNVCRTILRGIEYMHSRGVVHRDLTMPNVLFRKNGDWTSLKIIDFTLAKVLGPEETSRDFCGTLGYIAPEVYQERPYRFEVDMFAFGVILFRLLSGGEPPFATSLKQSNPDMLKQQTIALRYSLEGEAWSNVSSLGKDMVSRLLTHSKKRHTVQSALEHAWISTETK